MDAKKSGILFLRFSSVTRPSTREALTNASRKKQLFHVIPQKFKWWEVEKKENDLNYSYRNVINQLTIWKFKKKKLSVCSTIAAVKEEKYFKGGKKVTFCWLLAWMIEVKYYFPIAKGGKIHLIHLNDEGKKKYQIIFLFPPPSFSHFIFLNPQAPISELSWPKRGKKTSEINETKCIRSEKFPYTSWHLIPRCLQKRK